MKDILQRSIPYDVFTPRPLPGIQPLDMGDWLIVDDAYAEQMAERRRVLEEVPDAVLQMDAQALAPAQELLEMVLAQLDGGAPTGFVVDHEAGSVTRPDGDKIALDREKPLHTLAHLLQEDLCILQKIGDEHVLTGAVLCFPASWMLAEKFMQPLTGIHIPVGDYTEDIARRVQRLFDGVRAGRPLWRFNALWYANAALHQPRSAHARRDERFAKSADFMRSEKQCILRLPETGAVVFSIHTFVVARRDLAVPETDMSEIVG
jgi:hypothetical protein